jgi:hypothetical protein
MTSPFETSLAAFDATVTLADLRQIRAVLPTVTLNAINFVIFFRHATTNRVLAYDLLANTWSDVTSLRDWDAPGPIRVASSYLPPLR